MDNEPRVEFSQLWMKLSPQQKKARLNKAFLIIKRAADEQLAILNKIEKSPKIEKNIGFIYFFNTVKNFWANAEFAYSLGKGRNRRFCAFPARLLMETVLRLEFYINKSKAEQDDIAVKELLRGCKRFYDRDFAEGRDNKEIKDYYDNFSALGKYPDIDHANPNLDPFPKMPSLTSSSKIEDAKNWYFHYQALAESTHGKLLAIKMVNSSDLGEYVRCMMCVHLMCNKALLIVDHHIGGTSKNIVTKAIKDSEALN